MADPTQVAIASVAERLFVEKGIDAVSVGEVCAAAGCSRSTFYYHFDNKEALLLYLISFDYVREVSPPLPAGAQGQPRTPLEEIRTLREAFFRHTAALGPAFLRRLFQMLLEDREFFFNRNYRNQARVLVPLIRRCQETGAYANRADPEELARVEVLVTSQLTYIWACADGSFDLIGENMRSLRLLYGSA